eukprot:GFYU01005953.1.p1 GENE.GFYU01005953.1~~GFYU01005953.1.p1  ORF type:complete len:416 (-),score=127.35 GFYU01005953.1:395-1600(-)
MAKPSASKIKKSSSSKGGSFWACSLPCVSIAFLLGCMGFTHLVMSGNPTQKLDQIISLIFKGVPESTSVDKFDGAYVDVDGNTQHNAYDGDIANSFYNLATELYEWGWGDSFHFGYRHKSEGHRQAILNSQNFVAQKLGVKDMDRVLDMGCGVGGPLRGIVRATGANVTGLTINKHQVARAKRITAQLTPYMQKRCHYVVGDYLNVKSSGLEEGVYDAAFYMESSLHCENRTQTFSETYRLLKPGGRLVAMEYVTLPGWNASDPEHAELMRKHLHGNGSAKTPTIAEDLAMIRAAGFEVKEHFDLMARGKELYGDEEFPWWGDLQFVDSAALLPAHPWVRKTGQVLLEVLNWMGICNEDVPKASDLMNEGGDGLSGLGKINVLTPQYFVLGVKPLNAKKNK